MNRWIRRLIYLVVTLLWVGLMTLPVVAIVIAINGDLRIGSESRRLRLFSVSAPDTQGVGVEWVRPLHSGEATATCSQTTVRFLLWEGQAEGANYCQCFDTEGRLLASDTEACNSP